ncbi:molybdenum cofactor guanylyltransferase [Carboxylicivirga sp. N1Y90]|uniref:molybdenum cofactor guanylyltransferase n=1 Tax=Carboxylicivirga fragile TaxID=3417571 RepID=UPI003D3274A8|nr:molybdenum cofactor guanylyltransferase [Marinilabiliaceae bacterium N1Y90]
MKISGVVLAGGKSSRMGADKGMLDYKGKKLVSYAIELLEAYCDEIIISTNSPLYGQFGFKVIADSFLSKGPLSGIYEGLKFATNDKVLVLSCDMPNLNKEAIEVLIAEIDEKHDCFIPSVNSKFQPLFAVYNRRLLSAMEQHLLADKLKMMTFIEGVSSKIVSFDSLLESYPLLFQNCNRPEDLSLS